MTNEFLKGDRLRIKLTALCTAVMVVTSIYHRKRSNETIYRLTWQDYAEGVLDSWFQHEMDQKWEMQRGMLDIFRHDMNRSSGWGEDWSMIDAVDYAITMRKQMGLFNRKGPMEEAIYDKPHRYELISRIRQQGLKEVQVFTLTTSSPTRLCLQDVEPELIQPTRTWFVMNTG